MPVNARRKGKRVEREIAKLLRPIFPDVQRNANHQSRDGGIDLIQTEPFAFEVKGDRSFEKSTFAKSSEWVKQVQGEAEDTHYPFVVYRPYKAIKRHPTPNLVFASKEDFKEFNYLLKTELNELQNIYDWYIYDHNDKTYPTLMQNIESDLLIYIQEIDIVYIHWDLFFTWLNKLKDEGVF